MKAQIDDRRTDSQKETLTIMVVGYDSFMSGWGGARGGESWAGWACTPEDAATVAAWIKKTEKVEFSRRVRVDDYKPSVRCAHLAIYPVHENHISLKAEVQK